MGFEKQALALRDKGYTRREIIAELGCSYGTAHKYKSPTYEKRRKENEEYLLSMKDNPCSICGIKYHPAAMDFHHRNPSEKKFSVGSNFRKYALKSVKAEIEKCDLICSNCHRILEYEKNGSYILP